MISYAPYGEDEDLPVIKKVPEPLQAPSTTTECNMLVMVFIAGVVLLSLMDTVS
jgi:hypothetical protein